MLHTICYISNAKPNFSFYNQEVLFRQTKENNDNVDISGALIYYDFTFLQILEGEDTVIVPLFEKIRKDNRHHDIIEITNTSINNKSFQNFGLGYEIISDIEKLYSLKEYADFLANTKQGSIHLNLVTKIIEKFLSVDFK